MRSPERTAIDPTSASPIEQRLRDAVSRHRQGRLDEAAAGYEGVLAERPAHAEAMHLLGVVEHQRGRRARALELIQAAIALSPGSAAMQLNLGVTLQSLGRHEEALAAFEGALQSRPALVEAELRRASSLHSLRRHGASLAAYERVLAARPEDAAALIGRGNELQLLGRHQEALRDYERALALDPARVEVHNNRGSALRGLKRYGDAAAAFELLAQARPGFDYALSNQLHSRLYACDWRDYAAQVAALRRRVLAGERADVPFSFLAISDSPVEQLACARRYVADHYPPAPEPLWRGQARRAGRIRLAYLSADFHEHATAYLLAGVLEAHDRERFETIAVSIGPDADDPMRRRLRAAFDAFVDAREMSDLEAATRLRQMDVDILVDLKGFTVGNRAGILAHRPAPLQVAYLGYPGTSGAPYIDYLIADERVLPPEQAAAYSERIVWMPDSYQANDRYRAIAPDTPTRADCGLPPAGFVFCCFNNSYKLQPESWSCWMRLLQRVPGSVLWLIEDNEDAVRNLRREAGEAGVAPERLVFAPRLPLDRHLARHRLADLFLDTWPCNAHTTASDALWAGLPVLTHAGGAFAGRVAASLLHALGLDRLVHSSIEGYEAAALRLATDPAELAGVRARLAAARGQAPLFDTGRFRVHLESALELMWQRHVEGAEPRSFHVPACDVRAAASSN